jgi:SAM-dependent MidA family methyltransferase
MAALGMDQHSPRAVSDRVDPPPSAVAPPAHPAPAWLAERLRRNGGWVSFRTYMEWVLHDPDHGAYGRGRLRIGPRGDFATAPSLSADFAELLAPQLAQWLEQLLRPADPAPLALVEAGPGEGTLALQLAEALVRDRPDLAGRLEMVLIEPNPGMAARQRQLLRSCLLPVRWSGFDALARSPLRAVVIAHEVLDALAVERIEWDGRRWRRQGVALAEEGLVLAAGAPLRAAEVARLEELGLAAGAGTLPAGWSTELHPGLEPWLAACGRACGEGFLLVIDYALEARRYYAPSRADGTLLAYRGQRMSADPLLEPGQWDLTAHLCLESLERAACSGGWRWLGQRRQGEALLALGLAERLHGLQHQPPGRDVALLLARREAMLRLVDPASLGEFRWIALARPAAAPEGSPSPALPLFLGAPA